MHRKIAWAEYFYRPFCQGCVSPGMHEEVGVSPQPCMRKWVSLSNMHDEVWVCHMLEEVGVAFIRDASKARGSVLSKMAFEVK